MVTFEQLKNKEERICIVGLGYVGLPLTVQFAKKFNVVGFDVNKKRIVELKNCFDHTKEVLESDLKNSVIEYTFEAKKIKECKFIVVAVPTPIKEGNLPDMSLVEKASVTVGQNLSKDSVVVYESTVYPGATEEICLPILEKYSGLKAGLDFKIGYSPERVNPGDKEHTIDRVVKVVSGMDAESLGLISKVYGEITNTFEASSIKVAEAAKVIENTQRDLNVALVNELAMIFEKMDISIYDVLSAAGTKWNFLKFTPGLVGGHCIGVDPYYLTYKAEILGHHPEVILAGRKVNDGMGKYIAQQIMRKMSKGNFLNSSAKVSILGITFKENVPDIRNSKVLDIYNEFVSFGIKPLVFDPVADTEEVEMEYDLKLSSMDELFESNVVILAVAHDEFKEFFLNNYKKLLKDDNSFVADIKNVLDKQELNKNNLNFWSL